MARFGGAVGVGPSLIYEQQALLRRREMREAMAKGANPFAGYQPGNPDPGFAGAGGIQSITGPGLRTGPVAMPLPLPVGMEAGGGGGFSFDGVTNAGQPYGDDMIATRIDPLQRRAVAGDPGGALGAGMQRASAVLGTPPAAPAAPPSPVVADASGLVNLGGKSYRKGPGGWTEVQAPAPANPLPAAAGAQEPQSRIAPVAPRVAAVPRSRDVYGRPSISAVNPDAVRGVLGGMAGGNMGRSGPLIAELGGGMAAMGGSGRPTTAPTPATPASPATPTAPAGGDTVELGGKRYRKVGGRWQPA